MMTTTTTSVVPRPVPFATRLKVQALEMLDNAKVRRITKSIASSPSTDCYYSQEPSRVASIRYSRSQRGAKTYEQELEYLFVRRTRTQHTSTQHEVRVYRDSFQRL